MRQKRCVNCHKLFEPDCRTKGKQRYCSNQICQTKRQRKNEKDWRNSHPEALEKQRQQSREWHKARQWYYYYMGWDEKGVPTPEKLVELGLA